uniref:Transmembrane protein 222a n=1 Tax=Astatotilapia calliptera TaxID=8154 RepID=A0A3P8PPW0_ASTCA
MKCQCHFLGGGGSFRVPAYYSRYPFCIVWTPIPILTWVLPFIGHMGICTSAGVIRDFAGSYFVSSEYPERTCELYKERPLLVGGATVLNTAPPSRH